MSLNSALVKSIKINMKLERKQLHPKLSLSLYQQFPDKEVLLVTLSPRDFWTGRRRKQFDNKELEENLWDFEILEQQRADKITPAIMKLVNHMKLGDSKLVIQKREMPVGNIRQWTLIAQATN